MFGRHRKGRLRFQVRIHLYGMQDLWNNTLTLKQYNCKEPVNKSVHCMSSRSALTETKLSKSDEKENIDLKMYRPD